VTFDCRTCGACCINLPANQAEGFADWVEIAPTDALLDRKDLVKKHVTYDIHGVPHLRMSPTGRCLALRGALGRDVSCTIYADRPTPCRKVQPGDSLCLRYRAEHGIAATPV
jgi:Fe-S-cluster containining protein